MGRKQALGLATGALLSLVGAALLLYDSAGIIITWETASEVDTQGFNLFRSVASENGPFVQVNGELIPARGDPLTGGGYRIRDRTVDLGRMYVYQIEEVEWGGTRRRYPEVVQARAGTPRWLSIAEGLVLISLGCGLIHLQALSRHQQGARDQVQYQNRMQNGDTG